MAVAEVIEPKVIGPTEERKARAEERGSSLRQSYRTDHAGIVAWRDDVPTVLTRYLKRREITQRQYDAGCRLHEDFTIGGLEPCVIGQYQDMVSSGSVALLSWSEAREAARKRFNRAMTAIGPIASPEVSTACLADESVGRAGLEILRRGLDLLADFYGLPA